jgi:ABC-2 type transport system ATP-binding protein
MIVEVSHVSKRFGLVNAVEDVSFSVGAGEIVGLLGPNGAGKSTLLHILLGFIPASAGHVHLFGLDSGKNRDSVFSRLNFQSPYAGFPQRLTVFENLLIYAKLYGMGNARKSVQKLLNKFNLEDLRDKRMHTLSSGQIARVGLCKAFMNRPQLLILDEPLANLDPNASAAVTALLLESLSEFGTTILYTSHDMGQVENLCKRVIFIHHGRKIADGSPMEVTRCLLKKNYEIPALGQVFLSLANLDSREAV